MERMSFFSASLQAGMDHGGSKTIRRDADIGRETALGRPLVACKRHTALSGLVGSLAAEKAEGGLRADPFESFRKCQGVIQGDLTKTVIRDCTGIGAQTIQGRLLISQCICHRRIIDEIIDNGLAQPGVIDPHAAAPDHRHQGNSRISEADSKRTPADHAGGTGYDDPLSTHVRFLFF